MSETAELWRPSLPNFEYPDAVLEVKERMNSLELDEVVDDVPIFDRGRINGIDSAVIGDETCSRTEAALLYKSYNNGIRSVRNRIKADFIRRSMEAAGIRDDAGDPLPVIVIASPSWGSSINTIKGENKDYVSDGDFYPASEPTLDVAASRGFGKVALIGDSSGGTFAIHAAAQAEAKNLDLTLVAPSSMPGTQLFEREELFSAFKEEGHYLRQEVQDAGLDAYTKAMGYDKKFPRLRDGIGGVHFVMSAVASHFTQNSCIFAGLHKPTFEEALMQAVKKSPSTPIVVGYGNYDSIVAESAAVQSILAKARQQVRPSESNISSVEIDEGRHTWSNNVPLYAAFVLHAYEKAIGSTPVPTDLFR